MELHREESAINKATPSSFDPAGEVGVLEMKNHGPTRFAVESGGLAWRPRSTLDTYHSPSARR